jgi:hypothetical protein
MLTLFGFQTKKYHPRRAHTKSRAGCLTCKYAPLHSGYHEAEQSLIRTENVASNATKHGHHVATASAQAGPALGQTFNPKVDPSLNLSTQTQHHQPHHHYQYQVESLLASSKLSERPASLISSVYKL